MSVLFGARIPLRRAAYSDLEPVSPKEAQKLLQAEGVEDVATDFILVHTPETLRKDEEIQSGDYTARLIYDNGGDQFGEMSVVVVSEEDQLVALTGKDAEGKLDTKA